METVRNILETKATGVFATPSDATVLNAVDEMCKHKIGALLVKKNNVVVGIVSERDVMTRVVLARIDPATTTVHDIMTHEVVCVGIDEHPERAMAIMTERRCRHLPVIVDSQIAGVLSIGDLIRWTSRNREAEIRTLEDYVLGKYPG